MENCQCEPIRSVVSGLEIGISVIPSECQCNNINLIGVRIAFSDRSGYFSTWPDYVDVYFTIVLGCSMIGSGNSDPPGSGPSVTIDFNEDTEYGWDLIFQGNILNTEILTVTGLNGFTSGIFNYESVLITSSNKNCFPRAFPGDVMDITAGSGGSMRVTSTLLS